MNEYRKINIKDWAVEDRPREKMVKHGFHALSDAELLAILIGSGNTSETAVELSRRILLSFKNDLNTLSATSIDKLKTFKGIGEAKAVNIMAALELGRRCQNNSTPERPKITSSTDIFILMTNRLSVISHEEFWAVLLDRSNRVIDSIQISKGGVSSTIIDVRIILKFAIEKLASSIILVHNHPSGNLSPSANDHEITRKIKEGASMVDISVLDHVIIAGKNHTSFSDEGWMS